MARDNCIASFILRYGSIDGAHHKQWVLDQVLKVLLEDKYEETIKEYESDGEYEWNKGIAP